MKPDRKEQSRKSFDKDAKGYDSSWIYGQVRSKYRCVIDEVVRHKFSRCLDVGCGTGALLSMISRRRGDALLLVASAGLAARKWSRIGWTASLLVAAKTAGGR